jgi:2-polyprenyl-6-methoxyphenol hydroxylase-like FAD-dependent oxidoreductase
MVARVGDRARRAVRQTHLSDVVIAGGGVAGLAVANALARRGIASVVLEQRRAPGEIDRGDVIQDSVLPLLRRWNLEERLAAYGPVQLEMFRILNDRGRVIFEVDLHADLRRAARLTLVTHPDLERLLEQAAMGTGLVGMRRGVRCLDLLVDRDRVVGVRTDGGDVRAALTVVASGAQTALRDRHFPGRSVRDYAFSFYNARVELLPEYADAGYYILGRTGVMVMAPLPRGEMRIGIQFRRTADSQGVSARNFAQVAARRLTTFPVEKLRFLGGHVYHLSRSLGRTLAIPGAVLVGDAAHTVHPAGGQGMNLAFQDAELLAELIAAANGRPELVDDAGRRYSVERRRRVKRVLHQTHVMGLLGSFRSRGLIGAREVLLRMCNRSPWIKRHWVQRVIDVG